MRSTNFFFGGEEADWADIAAIPSEFAAVRSTNKLKKNRFTPTPSPDFIIIGLDAKSPQKLQTISCFRSMAAYLRK